MSVSAFNRRWAAVILEALTRHGVQHICIAPGSRSTPLTLAAAENRAFIYADKCLSCGMCAMACPRNVIHDKRGLLTPRH